jgi:hypothetical protein
MKKKEDAADRDVVQIIGSLRVKGVATGVTRATVGIDAGGVNVNDTGTRWRPTQESPTASGRLEK